jgi:hypothetical protein
MCGMCGMCFVNGEVVVPIMPFGKYRGRSLTSIPGSYLFWCLEEADLRPDLHGAIQAELVRRILDLPAAFEALRSEWRDGYNAALARPSGQLTVPDARQIVTECLRPLALRHHPDRGGDVSIMAALNAYRAAMLAALDALDKGT